MQVTSAVQPATAGADYDDEDDEEGRLRWKTIKEKFNPEGRPDQSLADLGRHFHRHVTTMREMMGQVVAHMFSAIIGFLYKDDPSKRKEVMKREIEFFNVHIEFGSCILGMAVALEEQKRWARIYQVNLLQT